MKLISTEYDDDLKDWDMNYIKQVIKTYGKVSTGIKYWKQELLGNILGPSVLPSQLLPGQVAPIAPVDTLFNEPMAQQAKSLVQYSNPRYNKNNHCLNGNPLCHKTCVISKTFVINQTITTD